MKKKSTKGRVEKQIDRWPLRQRPGFLIRRLHQIHVALFQERCSEFDITPLQYSLLTALAVRQAADQTTLAADISLDRTTTTGALKRLQSRHFIERAVPPDNRRARMCKLTATGASLLAEMEEPAVAAHRDTLASLSASEQKQFIKLMQRVVDQRVARR